MSGMNTAERISPMASISVNVQVSLGTLSTQRLNTIEAL